jgi:TRAP-type C4-dicarboxylate transport system permease small subunit
MYPEVNYLAILVCGLVSMVLGSLWYGPLFGKPWMAMIGIKKPDVMTPAIKKMMAKSYSIMFIGSLLMAFILGNILAYGGGGAGGVVGGCHS